MTYLSFLLLLLGTVFIARRRRWAGAGFITLGILFAWLAVWVKS